MCNKFGIETQPGSIHFISLDSFNKGLVNFQNIQNQRYISNKQTNKHKITTVTINVNHPRSEKSTLTNIYALPLAALRRQKP